MFDILFWPGVLGPLTLNMKVLDVPLVGIIPDDQEFQVKMQRMSDGEVRLITEAATEFYWSDGNGSCDCNRHLCFERAVDPKFYDEVPCGDSAYKIVEWIPVGDK